MLLLFIILSYTALLPNREVSSILTEKKLWIGTIEGSQPEVYAFSDQKTVIKSDGSSGFWYEDIDKKTKSKIINMKFNNVEGIWEVPYYTESKIILWLQRKDSKDKVKRIKLILVPK